MTADELIQTAQFLVDAEGNKKAIVVDYALWEELLTLLEDLEDAEENRQMRESGEEAIPWEQAQAELAKFSQDTNTVDGDSIARR
ncbi:MAG: hypothetical protein IT324_14285 [Anaerolineae bacterium]|nr:hypothetical protein [Anaerolineae bacterium]